MKKFRLLFLVILSLVITACATPAYQAKPVKVTMAKQQVNMDDSKKVKKLLHDEYKEWKSVRHRTGGLSKKGIDCSGYVYKTYLNRFGRHVPRATELLSETGVAINKSELRPGDLVFFKTGLFKKHVGIYLDNRNFVHVSSSKGVTISSLDNDYWAEKYWKSRRIR
jgi:cell wall-associated NlpC family hydrolase